MFSGSCSNINVTGGAHNTVHGDQYNNNSSTTNNIEGSFRQYGTDDFSGGNTINNSGKHAPPMRQDARPGPPHYPATDPASYRTSGGYGSFWSPPDTGYEGSYTQTGRRSDYGPGHVRLRGYPDPRYAPHTHRGNPPDATTYDYDPSPNCSTGVPGHYEYAGPASREHDHGPRPGAGYARQDYTSASYAPSQATRAPQHTSIPQFDTSTSMSHVHRYGAEGHPAHVPVQQQMRQARRAESENKRSVKRESNQGEENNEDEDTDEGHTVRR